MKFVIHSLSFRKFSRRSVAGISLLLFSLIGFPLATVDADDANTSNADERLNELRVLSYNIRHGRGMDKKVDLDRIAKVIDNTSPHLVALQEVDINVKRSGELDTAAILGKKLEMEHRFGKFMAYQGGEYGLAILSKFPIIESTVHPLPAGSEPRVALEVQVDLPAADGGTTRCSFVCVHFNWTRDDQARFEQAKTLIEVLRERPHPVIIAGDYNDVRGSRTLEAFAAEYHFPETVGPTFPSVNPSKEIDFISYRGLPTTATKQVIAEELASDHRPLLATIPLKE